MTWWESWFGEEYLDLYPHRDLDAARREAAFALAHLPPGPAPLLDLCCGSGRHSVPFAEARVWRRRRPRAPAPRSRGDATAISSRPRRRTVALLGWRFGRIVGLFTSFGYFLRVENVSVVAGSSACCAGAGRFCATRSPGVRRRCRRSADSAAKAVRSDGRRNAETRRIERRSRFAARAHQSAEVCAYGADELAELFRRGAHGRGHVGRFDGAPVGAGHTASDRPRAQARRRVIRFRSTGPRHSSTFLRGLPEFFPDPPTLTRGGAWTVAATGARAAPRLPPPGRRGGSMAGPRRRPRSPCPRATRSDLHGPLFTLMRRSTRSASRATSRVAAYRRAPSSGPHGRHDLRRSPARRGRPEGRRAWGADHAEPSAVGRLAIPRIARSRGLPSPGVMKPRSSARGLREADAPGTGYGEAFIETLLVSWS
jgi:hypothetical protein